MKKDEVPPIALPLDAEEEDEVTVARARAHGVEERTFDLRKRIPRQSDAPSLNASRAGDYILDKILAEGGFGVVYRGVHASQGTPAAIKILHPELVSDPDVLARFEREIYTMRRIRHPHVIEIFDFGRLRDGRPYFAMELLQGKSLDLHLFNRGRFRSDEVLAIMEPLCSALETTHAQGVIHRDLKPSNVFLCDDGRIVLLDFGIAKMLDPSKPSLTSSRHVVGTPAFISPEQLLNQTIDARTDIYALGALLYVMLTGSPPFPDCAYPILRQLHLYNSPIRPSARAPVSAAFDAIILRAMSKSPATRQQSTGALLAEIRAAASQELRDDPDRAAPRGRLALGILVEVLADADALESPTDPFLSDFESILPWTVSELSARGYASVSRTSTSALLAATLPDGTSDAVKARRTAVMDAVALYGRLAARAGQDPRINVRFCLHTGELVTADDGSFVDGELLELAWVPEKPEPGVHASPAMLTGLPDLDVAVRNAGGAASLLRLA